MTWLNRLKNVELEVITGDEKVYKPLWQEAERNLNFNTEAFDFVGVAGTFVERKEKSGDQFPINFIFQGEDCIDVAKAFLISASDKRPWTIKHPFYDDLLVQPISLRQVNTVYNISRITGIVWETITTKYPEDEIVPKKTVENLKADSDVQVAVRFKANVPNPSVNLIASATKSVTNITKNYNPLAILEKDVKLLKDLARTASGAAQNLLDNVDRFITSTIALINFPFQIIQTLELKINKIKDSIDELFDIFSPDSNEQQYLYEALATSSITEMSLISVSPASSSEIDINIGVGVSVGVDYKTRIEVAETFEQLDETYTSVLVNFDNTDFIQDAILALDLDIIVNYSMANLYEIAFNSKQERSILIEKDDNIVNLSHRFFGPGDENLQIFINQNKVTLEEYLIVKKGREIIWYV
ncbi:MAG: hypothetical protein MUP82_10360 [Candidatus Marinimicrobia bacterium]|nr:hypothetical protein [Candidatus Neomarinimicrobiota bacterium]